MIVINDNLVQELRKCGEALIKISEAIAASASKEEPPGSKPAPSMEELRAAMALKIQTGSKEAIKELLARFGAVRLSEVKTEHYPSLMQEVDKLP